MVVFFVAIIDLTALAVSIKVSQAYNADQELLLLPDSSSTNSFAPVKAVRAVNRSGFDSANRPTLVASSSPKTDDSADTAPASGGGGTAIAGGVLLALSIVMRHLRSHGSK
jgi:hypothetical protein